MSATLGFPNPPGVFTRVSNAAGAVSLPGGARTPAIIGEGITYKETTEQLTRTSGFTDE